jgi:magnesium-protoporphyrin O-methyltransferase
LTSYLAKRSRGPLLLTYAPYNPWLAMLYRIGGRFPHAQRRTAIQMLPDSLVEVTLAAAGMRIRRVASVGEGFYHVKLLQTEPAH